MDSYLMHHGIKGQKWGVRRYQNEDGTYTAEGQKHREKADERWVKKNAKSIYQKAEKASSKELARYSKKELDKNYKKGSAAYTNAYNKKMAELMNTAIGDVPAPSGRVVRFIAKRGTVGVHMALADVDYNMDSFKNGIWDSGRVAYKKSTVESI